MLLLHMALPQQLLLAGELFLLFLSSYFSLQLGLLPVGERIHDRLSIGRSQATASERALLQSTTRGIYALEATHSPDL